MHKLLNFMLLVTLIVASCFLTGCGDTDDDWKNPIGNEPVLSFTLGIKQETMASSRAAVLMPETITISGVTFNKSPNANNITYYTGNLTKTNLERIYQIGYALMDFNNSYHTIASSFFREAYNGTQPTALLVLDTDFSTVITAQANGKDVAKPQVSPYTPVSDPVLAFTLGIKQETIANSRAAVYMPAYITVSGVKFNKSSVADDITYYTGNLAKATLNTIYQIGYALLDFEGHEYKSTVPGSFFKEAYNGTQPTALLVLDTDFTTVITAQANGKDVIKPIVNRYDDPENKVTMELKLNEEPESVVLTVPQGLGTVSTFTNWVIVIDDKTAGKSISFARGEYEEYYGEIPSNGNSLILVLTPEGKQMFTKGHTYRGELISLEVQFKDGTQKYLDVSQCIADNVIWNK